MAARCSSGGFAGFAGSDGSDAPRIEAFVINTGILDGPVAVQFGHFVHGGHVGYMPAFGHVPDRVIFVDVVVVV